MNHLVTKWYENKNNVDEMNHWENSKLKKWEMQVVEYFPAK